MKTDDILCVMRDLTAKVGKERTTDNVTIFNLVILVMPMFNLVIAFCQCSVIVNKLVIVMYISLSCYCVVHFIVLLCCTVHCPLVVNNLVIVNSLVIVL